MSDATRSLHVDRALTPEGWRENTRLTWSDGVLTHVESDVAERPGEARAALAIPGVGNLHSHAFQRAMSGLAERRGPGADSFWSWRETMYRFALNMDPDDVESVAALAYVEMLEAGYTRVGEFHYLHHAPDGHAYDDIAEMSARVTAAASDVGIGMTLLPVFYAHSGFGGAAPGVAQRRFINDLDGFARLWEGARNVIGQTNGGRLGLAPHSLRAATPSEIRELVALVAGAPLHIHVAEQTAEVDACLVWSGARPVQYLLDHFDVGPSWCLIHATHMTNDETKRLAASGAVAGLCPITEANLGDGFFNAPAFLAAGGRYGIGTDSNVEITLSGELRLFEYGQRLLQRARNVLTPPGRSTGRSLFDASTRGGAQALGSARSGFEVGADADIVTLRTDFVADDALDSWIFSAERSVDKVYARGALTVDNGAHIRRTQIVERFRATMRKLRAG